jgi:hypothetical protein
MVSKQLSSLELTEAHARKPRYPPQESTKNRIFSIRAAYNSRGKGQLFQGKLASCIVRERKIPTNSKKGEYMKRFLLGAVLLSVFFVVSTVSAQTDTVWPHGGKYGFGTRYYYLENYLSKDIYIGVLSGNAQYPPQTDAFVIKAGKDTVYQVSNHWSSSRIWGRVDSVETGPFTLAEITQRGYQGTDYYDVSLVDGYNLPLIYRPVPGTFVNNDTGNMYSCGTAGCKTDLMLTCPAADLQKDALGNVVACVCADTLKKQACPTAYSYPYDDATSTFRCPSPNVPDTIGPDYIIDFGFPPAMAVNKKPTFNYSFIDAMAVTMTKDGELKYTYNGSSANARLSLYSCNGKLAVETSLTGSSGTVHVPALARGLYFVVLAADNRVKTSTMMVVR